MAEQEGLSTQEREQAQRFESEDPRRGAALRLASEIVVTRGHASDEAVETARAVGYDDEQIIEVVANVALTTFSNHLNDTIQTEVDVPTVEPVQSR